MSNIIDISSRQPVVVVAERDEIVASFERIREYVAQFNASK